MAQAAREIVVKNESQRMILVKVATQQTVLTKGSSAQAFAAAASSSQSSSDSSEQSGKVGGGYGGVSAEVSLSQKKENSQSSSQSGSNENSSSQSFEQVNAGFIEVGFVQVKPGSAKPFAVDKQMAYVSVAVLEGDKVYIPNWTVGANRDYLVFKDGDLNVAEKPQKAKQEEKAQNESTAWRSWVTGNTNGEERDKVLTEDADVVYELIAREQGGYGLVNIGISKKNGKDYWTCGNQNGKKMSVFIGSQIVALGVREQSGYGIVNMRAYTKQGPTAWVCGNMNGEEKRTATATIHAFQGREQSGYGIVDVRVESYD